MHKKTSTLIIALIGLSAIVMAAQMNTPRVMAAEIPIPAPDVSYTWNVLASSGNVWWYVFSDEGQHAIEVDGRFTYNLTGTHANDVPWTLPSGNVWFGNLSIYYANGSRNFLKTNCSNNEAGYALALSAGNWVGGFVAPSNWSQNYFDLTTQSGTSFLYRDIGGTVVIDYTTTGQATHLEYNKTTSVLTYAKTYAYGFSMEIQLAGLSSLPVAALAVNASTLIQGMPVQFTDRSYAGVRPYTYSWDFGDTYSSNLQNPAHIYSLAGNYSVNLTITDAASNKSTYIQAITVQLDTYPVADFIMTGTPDVGVVLVFNNTSSNGNMDLTYTWNFGDGSPVSHLQNVTHAFNRTGTFTVTLTARDIDGDMDTHTQVIVIPAEVPGADLTLLTIVTLLSAGSMAVAITRKVSRKKLV